MSSDMDVAHITNMASFYYLSDQYNNSVKNMKFEIQVEKIHQLRAPPNTVFDVGFLSTRAVFSFSFWHLFDPDSTQYFIRHILMSFNCIPPELCDSLKKNIAEYSEQVANDVLSMNAMNPLPETVSIKVKIEVSKRIEFEDLDGFYSYLMRLNIPVHLELQEDEEQQLVPASRASVEALETKRLEEGGEWLKKECAVCLNKFLVGESGTWMPCSHMFHKDCIHNWLKTANSCPLCRFKLPIEFN